MHCRALRRPPNAGATAACCRRASSGGGCRRRCGCSGAGPAARTPPLLPAPAFIDSPGGIQVSRPRWTLPDGTPVDCVVEIDDEKERIFDGTTMVTGTQDGQVSGASFEPGPWTWVESRRMWIRDTFPHDVLVVTPCGHAYSERFWSEIMSTTIERANAHTFRARKARCRAACGRWRLR